MEKLVLTYTATDGMTYTDVFHEPFYYETLAAAKIDFEAAYRRARDIDHYNFKFNNYEFETFNFTFWKDGYHSFSPPKILTLEDWFEKNKF